MKNIINKIKKIQKQKKPPPHIIRPSSSSSVTVLKTKSASVSFSLLTQCKSAFQPSPTLSHTHHSILRHLVSCMCVILHTTIYDNNIKKTCNYLHSSTRVVCPFLPPPLFSYTSTQYIKCLSLSLSPRLHAFLRASLSLSLGISYPEHTAPTCIAMPTYLNYCIHTSIHPSIPMTLSTLYLYISIHIHIHIPYRLTYSLIHSLIHSYPIISISIHTYIFILSILPDHLIDPCPSMTLFTFSPLHSLTLTFTFTLCTAIIAPTVHILSPTTKKTTKPEVGPLQRIGIAHPALLLSALKLLY